MLSVRVSLLRWLGATVGRATHTTMLCRATTHRSQSLLWDGRSGKLSRRQEVRGGGFPVSLDATDSRRRYRWIGWRAYSEATLKVGELVRTLGVAAMSELNEPVDQSQLQRSEFE